jgi:hypothetical protein
MQGNHEKEILSIFSPETIATLVSLGSAFIYVGLGHMARYVNVKKRFPTLKELFRDIILIAFMGVVASGFLEFFEVRNTQVIGGASALFGYFGPKSINLLINIVLKKMGYKLNNDVCALENLDDKETPKK